MYRDEIVFIKKFVASLKKRKVNSIPFKNERFFNGMAKMKEYFIANLQEYDGSDISLLFLQRPIDGDYSRLEEGLLSLNGSFASFVLKNPYYEEAILKLSEDEINYFLNECDLKFPNDQIELLAKAFCEGANL